ncbi:MAG: rRNA (adenine-N6)-dimethyltransferase [Patescibacteria group bacterium]|nr:rRNA (adenine-N6)-dimethyltransferase [Patescibacteria group bacterium]
MKTDKDNQIIKYTQNFLTNKKLVKNLINKTTISSEDLIIEVGPGKGILTEALKEKTENILAIEKDKELFLNLYGKYENYKNIKIIHQNFLDYELPNRKFKIFSNIPFNITSQIIKKITSSLFFEEGYLIVQKEYAEKICGYPYFNKNSKESLILKYDFDLNVLYKFKKKDFCPSPSINIVLLRMSRKNKKNSKEREDYFDFISYVFLRGKKNIKDSLKKIFTVNQLKRISLENSFNLNSKPTEINFEKWWSIFNYYVIGVENKKKNYVRGSFKLLERSSRKIKKIHRTCIRR